jgi:hypothetical protein
MAKPSGHPVPIHCPADRLGDDQPDLWRIACAGMSLAFGVHHEIRLRRPDTTAHGGAELI